MKKIGIMTWFDYNNYGTCLQVYALQECIKNLGYKAVVINYIQNKAPYMLNSTHFTEKQIVKFIKSYLLHTKLIESDETRQLFNDFRIEHLNLTNRLWSSGQLYALNDQFDAFVCGSDQIWSPGNYRPHYFLDFVEGNDRKVAYAPSLGKLPFTSSYIMDKTLQFIKTFNHLSVREESGREFIKNKLGRDVPVLMDPTLLIGKEFWRRFVKEDRDREKYILIYSLKLEKNRIKKYFKIAELLKKKYNVAKIKIIANTSMAMESGYELLMDVEPEQFVSSVSNAKAVVTDSYHGMVFSLIFNKPVYEVLRGTGLKDSENTRTITLADKLGVEGCLVGRGFDYSKDKLYDADLVNNKYEQWQRESLEFLKTSLLAATGNKHIFKKTSMICTGCGACKQICPSDAISMGKGVGGFYEASINDSKCIKCGKCQNVCPFLRSDGIKIEMGQLYSYKLKDPINLMNSSSGGASASITDYALDHHWYVYGCAYNEKKREAEHVLVTEDNKDTIKGSKYLQSYFENIYNTAEFYDDSRVHVVFGTPCQIGGLSRVLSEKGLRDQFVLVDLVCHGVPGYDLWNRYIDYIYDKFGTEKNPNVFFRGKEMGWRNRMMIIGSSDDERNVYRNTEDKDIFYHFFSTGHSYSRACYECPYRATSFADLRIGDYWGKRFLDDTTGVSMLLALTEKGREIVRFLKDESRAEMQQHEITDYNSQQRANNPIPAFWNAQMQDISDDRIPLEETDKKYNYEIIRYQEFLKHVGKIVKKLKSWRH